MASILLSIISSPATVSATPEAVSLIRFTTDRQPYDTVASEHKLNVSKCRNSSSPRPLSLFYVTDAIDSFVLIVLYLSSEKSQSTRWKITKWELGV